MRARAVIVAVVAACAVVGWWMYTGGEPSGGLVGRSNVVGGLAGLAALVVAVVVLWPRAGGRRRSIPAPVTAEQANAAVTYLAGETLRYWRVQAKARRITTPSPAAVRWRWAPSEVAVPVEELRARASVGGPVLLPQAREQVLTAGVVTRLREDLYQRLSPSARMVLLGGPGAGKTAAMLLLLIDVMEYMPAGCGEPVPVWLTLGGWNPNTTGLLEHAADVLARDFPGLPAPEHGGTGAAAYLLRTGRVALFLDGLDEMAADLRGAALTAIDRDSDGLRVVLTSRPEEYTAAVGAGRLYGAAVVELLPVGVEQAEAFLLAEQLEGGRVAWRHVIAQMRVHPDGVAARALTTPLALSLARDTYAAGGDPAELLDENIYPTTEDLQKHLLTRFLTIAYPEPKERTKALQVLIWIARHMGTSRDLGWWNIPGWWTHRWMIRLWNVLVFAVVGGIGGWVAGGPWDGLIVGLGFGAASFFRLGSRYYEAVFSVVVGLIVGLGFANVFGVAVGGLVGLATLAGSWGWAVRVGADWGIPGDGANAIAVYRALRRRTRVLTLGVGLAVGAVLGLIGALRAGLIVGVVGGIAFGTGFGLCVGATPTIGLSLVEVIWVHGLRRAPFMATLETAANRQVLRQAGEVYQFRHAALQDLLAADPLPPDLAASDR